MLALLCVCARVFSLKKKKVKKRYENLILIQQYRLWNKSMITLYWRQTINIVLEMYNPYHFPSSLQNVLLRKRSML